MPKTIELISRAAAIHRGRVLVCQKVGDPYWALPGGHVEPGESLESALRREMLEEAGVEIAKPRLWFIHENCFGKKGKLTHEIVFLFHVELTSASFITNPRSREKKLTFQWLALDRAASRTVDVRPMPLIQAMVKAGRRKSPSIISSLL